MHRTLLLLVVSACALSAVFAQAPPRLPAEVSLSADGLLTRGAAPVTGLYDPTQVHKLEITLAEPDWFRLLDGGRGPRGEAPVSLVGQLTFNDTLVLDSVVVSIKGQTSDLLNNSEKKSFKLEIDEYLDQDLLGYDNLNLNCGFGDPSSMREVLYYATARGFTHALKVAFVDLYINGDYWGPYGNIQQIEGTYIREWFTDNSGTRWRAENPDGRRGANGNTFNTGLATLNDLGADSTNYTPYYTLKQSGSDDPWQQLIDVVGPLNNLPIEELYTGLDTLIDIDRTLWMLAQEIVFVDDDSYINKGGMDYYVYVDGATERLMSMEVDGNSVMNPQYLDWGVFFNEGDDRYPLLNRLLQNPEARQRYLAHLRTVLVEYFVPARMNAQIDAYVVLLDARVQADPKAIFSYAEWTAGVQELRDFIQDRHDLLTALPAIDRVPIVVSDVSAQLSTTGLAVAEEPTSVRVTVDQAAERVVLYHATGVDGRYARTELRDDGRSGDGAAGDLTYGGAVPALPGGSFVRYYVEVVAADQHGTATYSPALAEHTVYTFSVALSGIAADDVVVNELMADNDAVVADSQGDFEDWVELYNTGSTTADLAGHHLTDDLDNLTKYTFPAGASIAPGDYLIVWLDEDSSDSTPGELHANFKLSKGGEPIHFVSPDLDIIDETSFGALDTDIAWARSPNGTGMFRVQAPTFDGDNDVSSARDISTVSQLSVYPNPVGESFHVRSDADIERLVLRTPQGQVVSAQLYTSGSVDTGLLPAGTYFLSAFAKTGGVIGRAVVIIR